MNRLYQLEQTLVQNIQDNHDYENLEFIIVDYNSADNLEQWAKNNLNQYIETGRLTYYKTFQPTYFNHSHAKNLAFKLSNGDIVCNINADHYTGKGYAQYINDTFEACENAVITPIPVNYCSREINDAPAELWGKVCLRKTDFLDAGGFDERMIKFGNDDIDFINRLVLLGAKRVLLEDKIFWRLITHDNQARHSSKKILNHIKCIAVKYINSESSEIIYLFHNGRFEMFTLIDRTLENSHDPYYSYLERKFDYLYAIKDLDWKKGTYKEVRQEILFYPDAATLFKFRIESVDTSTSFKDEESSGTFYLITNPILVDTASELNYVYYNLNIMQRNMTDNIWVANEHGFGKAEVFKNFDYANSITIN